MSYSDPRKVLKVLKNKPGKLKKWEKYNKGKKRTCGFSLKRCKLCGRIGAHISKYGVGLCRQCFREKATSIGFKKFS